MLPVRLVLAVEDESYIEPFLHYVRCSEYDRKVMITAYSRREALWSYIAAARDGVDAVLGERTFMEGWQGRPGKAIPWIELREEGGIRGRNQEPGVAKYQPIDQLLNEVLKQIRGVQDSGLPGRSTKVVAVVSAAGGTGKTTVTGQLSRQLATEGKRVFCMSLEWLQTGSMEEDNDMESESRPGLARLLYDLRVADEKQHPLQTPVSGYVHRSEFLRGDTFPLLSNLNEIREMTQDDIRLLIDYVAGSGSYDVLIVDTDSCTDGRAEAVMERCDLILWLVTGERTVLAKSDKWLTYLERSVPGRYAGIVGKTLFVGNRISEGAPLHLTGKGLAITASLSLVPAWAAGGALADGHRHSPAYQRDIMQLSRLMQDAWKVSDRGQT